jgi:hypothetical protein
MEGDVRSRISLDASRVDLRRTLDESISSEGSSPSEVLGLYLWQSISDALPDYGLMATFLGPTLRGKKAEVLKLPL